MPCLQSNVYLLIGSDCIWYFFDGISATYRGKKLGQGGPVAVSTKVGWVLSGQVENLPGRKDELERALYFCYVSMCNQMVTSEIRE